MANPNMQIVEAWFHQRQDKDITIILAGRIFGGRYGESPQRPREYQWNGRDLQVQFKETEVLTVVEPSNFELGKFGQLVVPRAKSATFGWHFYGRLRTEKNWCELTYQLAGDTVEMKWSGPLSGLVPEEDRFALSQSPFVELA